MLGSGMPSCALPSLIPAHGAWQRLFAGLPARKRGTGLMFMAHVLMGHGHP